MLYLKEMRDYIKNTYKIMCHMDRGVLDKYFFNRYTEKRKTTVPAYMLGRGSFFKRVDQFCKVDDEIFYKYYVRERDKIITSDVDWNDYELDVIQKWNK